MLLEAANAVSSRKEHAKFQGAQRTVDLFLVPQSFITYFRVSFAPQVKPDREPQ